MAKTNQLTIEFSAIPENVPFARVAVAAFASQLDFTINDLEEIKVMVSEAVGNAIIHGYNNAPGETVKITASINDRALTMCIEDTGKGMDNVEQALEAGYSTDPERMGLGFVFMQSFSEHMEVESRPGRGTRVTLIKKVTAGNKAVHTVR